jgi:tetratricopeptide (TPR) repeat protein
MQELHPSKARACGPPLKKESAFRPRVANLFPLKWSIISGKVCVACHGGREFSFMSSFRLPAAFIGLTVLGVVSLCGADVVHLKDGTKVEGIVKHADDGWNVRIKGKVTHIPSDQVESIELAATTAPTAAVANDRLESLRRSVEGLTDLTDIIARFQRFVDQNADAAATAEAKKDLALWQDRQKQKMVKVGAKWVLPEERQHLVDQAGTSADTARQLMKQGRTKEAEPLLVDCVAVDPQNATAQYLIGLLRYQQDQLPVARKAFEATAAVIPNHAPTLNNIGVIQFRQRQYIAALINFDAAMLTAPVNKIILDNVAITFQNLPQDLQRSPVTLKALRHFNEQDQQLSALMAHDGLHRYGSLWVTDKDLDDIKQQEKQIQDKLDILAGDFDRAKARVDQLESDISDNQTQMHRMEASSYVTDPRTGAQTQVPLPSAYYEMARDNEKRGRERDGAVAKLDVLKKQAQDLQNSRPSIKNQGVHLLIGVEGTPIRMPGGGGGAVAVPASQAVPTPATQPARVPAGR